MPRIPRVACPLGPLPTQTRRSMPRSCFLIELQTLVQQDSILQAV
jgi:hypothetical protein